MTIKSVSSTAPSSLSNAIQEARETPAQTRTEAANGDAQAKRKLAATAAAEASQSSAPKAADPEGKGKKVDTHA